MIYRNAAIILGFRSCPLLPTVRHLRVVVLTTYFKPIIGGVESTAERLARFLVRSGVEARVLTKRISRDLPDREIVYGAQARPDFRSRVEARTATRSPSGKWRLHSCRQYAGWSVIARPE